MKNYFLEAAPKDKPNAHKKNLVKAEAETKESIPPQTPIQNLDSQFR